MTRQYDLQNRYKETERTDNGKVKRQKATDKGSSCRADLPPLAELPVWDEDFMKDILNDIYDEMEKEDLNRLKTRHLANNTQLGNIKTLAREGRIVDAVKMVIKDNLYCMLNESFGIKQWKDIKFFKAYCDVCNCKLEDMFDSNEQVFRIKEDLSDAQTRVELYHKFKEHIDDYLSYLVNNEFLSEKHRKYIRGLLEQMKNSPLMQKEISTKIITTIISMPTETKRISETHEVVNIFECLDKGIFGYRELKIEIVADILSRGIFGRSGNTNQAKKGAFLIYGPPGVGKSMFAQVTADALGLPLHVINLAQADPLLLKGSYKTWNNATYGRIAEALIDNNGYKTCVILLDEIDKAAEGNNHGKVVDVISSILDPNINFKDDFLGIDLDLDNCIFFLTANDISGLPKNLLDRLTCLRVNRPSEQEAREILKFMVRRKNNSNNLVKIDEEAVLKMVEPNTISFRDFERILDRIIKRFVLQQILNHGAIKHNVIGEDYLKEGLQLQQKENRYIPVGFMQPLRD